MRLGAGCCRLSAAAICMSLACADAEPPPGLAAAGASDPAAGTVPDTVRLFAERQLRIGLTDGDSRYLFHRISGIATDSGGRIYVTDNGSLSIRTYNEQGEFVQEYGGSGEGPGEFRSIELPIVSAQVVAATDYRRLRLSIFSRDGAQVRSHSTLLPDGHRAQPIALSDNGWIVRIDALFSAPPIYMAGTQYQDTIKITTVPVQHLGEALARPASDSIWTTSVGVPGRSIYGTVIAGAPVGNEPLWEPAPSISAFRHGVVVSRGWPYRVAVYHSDGRVARVLSRDLETVEITDDLKRRVVEAVGHSGSPAERRQAVEVARARAELPGGKFVPVIGRVVAGEDGAVWVERLDIVDPVALEVRSRRVDLERVWDVWRANGDLRGTLATPPSFVPYDVTECRAVGSESDSLGVMYVVVYRVVGGADRLCS